MQTISPLYIWFHRSTAPADDVELVETEPSRKPVGRRPVFTLANSDADDAFNVDSILVKDFPQVNSEFDPFFGINFGFVNRVQGMYLVCAGFD